MRQKILEDSKKVVITEDTSLPQAIRIRLDETDSKKITLGKDGQEGTRVRVLGRAHRFRLQKDLAFMTLKDGYGQMQVVFTGDMIKTYAMLTMTLETSLEIKGRLQAVALSRWVMLVHHR